MKWLAILILFLALADVANENRELRQRCTRLEIAIWGQALHDMPPLPQPIKPKE